MRVHLGFDPLTLRSLATGEIPDFRKSTLFLDVMHGLGRRTTVLALALTAFFSSGTAAAGPPDHAAATPAVLGAGMGPNHVSIPVNADSWGRFAEGLGKGLENGGVEFSNHTYLEFLAVYGSMILRRPLLAMRSHSSRITKAPSGSVSRLTRRTVRLSASLFNETLNLYR
jgi:hypothetical protein